MLKKIVLVIKIIFPIAINIFLYLVIREYLKGTEFALSDTLFYLGMINLLYGVAALFVIRRSTGLYNRGTQSAINFAVADQNIKDYHDGKWNNITTYTVIDRYFKSIYVIIGILLIVAAVVSY